MYLHRYHIQLLLNIMHNLALFVNILYIYFHPNNNQFHILYKLHHFFHILYSELTNMLHILFQVDTILLYILCIHLMFANILHNLLCCHNVNKYLCLSRNNCLNMSHILYLIHSISCPDQLAQVLKALAD